MDINRTTVKNIIILGRPQYLAGNFLLFVMGALLAVILGAPFDTSKFVLGYFILLIAHLSVHYSNDYYDFEVDSITNSSIISGGSGVLVKNPDLKEFSRRFSIILMFLSILLAAVFTFIFNYPITFLLFIIFGNLLAWYYTAPPIRLVYNRLGELANIIAVIIFLGTGYFAMMGTLDLQFFLFSLPVIFLQIIFINSFEIPTMETDKIGKKITWIVSFGRAFGFKLSAICGLFATLSFILLQYTGLFPSKLNFQILALISLIALSLGFLGLIKKPYDIKTATKYATITVVALFLMSLLIDIYFLYLTL